MSKEDWYFRYSANIKVRMECMTKEIVLGQIMWVPQPPRTLLFRNVNLLWFDGSERIIMLAKQGEEITVDVADYDDENGVTPREYVFFRSGNHNFSQNGAITITQALTSATCEYNIGISDTKERITNTFFDFGRLKNKAQFKKMLKGEADVANLSFAAYTFYGKPADMTGVLDWESTFYLDGIEGFCFWTNKSSSAGKRPAVTIEKGFYKIDDTYLNKIRNKNTYSFNDLITNKVYDSDNALLTMTVDVYQHDNVMELVPSVADKSAIAIYSSMVVRTCNALQWETVSKANNVTIEKALPIYKSIGSISKTITFSQKSINETMGYKVAGIAIEFHGIGTDVENYDNFAGFGLVRIINARVNTAVYSSDHQNIKLVLHEYGEIPDGSTKEDEKNDNNDVHGDNPPSGHTPSDTSEIGVNLLTATYLLTKKQLNTLGNELWSPNFMNNVLMLSNSPIENILSCKIFPTTFSGVAAALKVGNVTMLNGENVQKISASGLSKDTGAINFPQLYNSFLDFEPFTQARIFIPFVGFQPLPVANFIGAQISLRYVFDVVTGAVSVYLLRNGQIFDKYSGICAVDVPLTASNRAQVEVGQIQSAITGVAQLATGNIGGALSAGLAIASTPNHFNTRGNAGGYTSQFDPRQPYIIIDRPKAQSEISSYGETNGFPCNLTKTLSTLKGFTSVHDIHLDDVPCLESERQELKSIMQKGFII